MRQVGHLLNLNYLVILYFTKLLLRKIRKFFVKSATINCVSSASLESFPEYSPVSRVIVCADCRKLKHEALVILQWRIVCTKFREIRPVESDVFTRIIDSHTQNILTSNPYFWLLTK